MTWTAGANVVTGDLITAATWNNYLGATGSIEYLFDNRELWSPATAWYDSSAATYHAPNTSLGFGVDVNDVNDKAFVNFRVPPGFSSITTASFLVLPLVTDAAANWGIFAYYGATGETSGTHAQSDSATTYNVTSSQWFEINVAGILTNLAAGDNVGMYLIIETNADRVILAGLRLNYQ